MVAATDRGWEVIGSDRERRVTQVLWAVALVLLLGSLVPVGPRGLWTGGVLLATGLAARFVWRRVHGGRA